MVDRSEAFLVLQLRRRSEIWSFVRLEANSHSIYFLSTSMHGQVVSSSLKKLEMLNSSHWLMHGSIGPACSLSSRSYDDQILFFLRRIRMCWENPQPLASGTTKSGHRHGQARATGSFLKVRLLGSSIRCCRLIM